MNHIKSHQTLQRLLTAVQDLSLARNLESVMHIVRTAARELTGADGATFVLHRNNRCYYVDEDAIAPLWKGQDFPMDHCVSGWAMQHHQTVVIEDIYADDRVPHDAYRPTFVKSMVMVPIRATRPVGAIGNYWANKHVPSPDEIKCLEALANSTMVTLENIQLCTDLEQKVIDRTADLEASNRALESFSYSVSHDLRAPLRKIGYYTELLAETAAEQLNGKGVDLLDKLNSQAREMSHLIDVLLQFSRVGKMPVSKISVSMTAIVDNIIRNVREQEPDRPVRFAVHPLPAAEADPDLIRQVWINLISNAVKYTGKKEDACIEIGGETRQGSIRYYIRDNGVGFDMHYADKLFSPFQRLHSRSEFEGTGIGLAIAERIMSRHNGKIWADAKPDEGACFYVELPSGST